ncbi:hypothetical protein L1987_38917 [Smallanthus sonchifolius]|uniref:Uncharacterized protein n=1 Tax=Smallanthus sonchifolius TaxID=185202 RepID=A0ACB9HMC6_9ASTR|nr:hypothetical protein L1987_38917 [Smallanthus sonchifolius]
MHRGLVLSAEKLNTVISFPLLLRRRRSSTDLSSGTSWILSIDFVRFDEDSMAEGDRKFTCDAVLDSKFSQAKNKWTYEEGSG